MINLTNDKLKRDLDQALADVNSLLDSYEARKEENLSLRSKLTDFESEIHRLESLSLKHSNDLDNEKQTVEKLV
jgi:predicted  nucleic acid-binding Zn-ribbon protein